MNIDNRYAILIGINDYIKDPLESCESDVNLIKDTLIDFCRFDKKNIYTLTSTTEKPVKNINGKLVEILNKIQKTFIPENDSILFHFSGHGFNFGGESCLKFHDINYPMIEVVNLLNPFNPKMQFYIIDACESGGKINYRGNKDSGKEIKIQEYIKNSSGHLYLFACKDDEKAIEGEEINNGLLTRYFVEAIKEPKNYDDDGILTPSRIQEYVAKHISTKTWFRQNPVIDTRTTGVYPFAFLNQKDESEEKKELDSVPGVTKSTDKGTNSVIPKTKNIEKKDLKIILNDEERIKNQSILFDFLDKIYDGSVNSINTGSAYNVEKHTTFKHLHINFSDLIDKIIKYAIENGLNCCGDVFIIDKFDNPEFFQPPLAIGSLPFSLLEKITRDPRIITQSSRYIIKRKLNEDSSYVKISNYIYKSEDSYKVNFGIGYIIYQARWGMCLVNFNYMLDWNGEKSNKVNNTTFYITPFTLGPEILQKAEEITTEEFRNMNQVVNNWNDERFKEINNFLSKAQKK